MLAVLESTRLLSRLSVIYDIREFTFVYFSNFFNAFLKPIRFRVCIV